MYTSRASAASRTLSLSVPTSFVSEGVESKVDFDAMLPRAPGQFLGVRCGINIID
jgi:hypothetical protein